MRALRLFSTVVLIGLVAGCAQQVTDDEAADSVREASEVPARDASATPAQPQADDASRYAHLPEDAAAVLRRFETCLRLDGQLDGNDDAQLRQQMEGFDCGDVSREVGALRERHADDAAVMGALAELDRGSELAEADEP